MREFAIRHPQFAIRNSPFATPSLNNSQAGLARRLRILFVRADRCRILLPMQERAAAGREARRWIIAPPWAERDRVARRLNIHPLVAQLLHNRKVQPDQAAGFLEPKLSNLYSPDLLPGCLDAARLIVERARQGKRIVIYGDYDVDGITGTAILWHLLKLAGVDVGYYIPHRLEEGYGLNADALRQLAREGADTVVSVDCGVTAIEEARVAAEVGLHLVVTDHHTIGPALPDARVVVHPLAGGDYPNPHLCGAGVAFKLAWAMAKLLCGSERVSPEYREFLMNAVCLAALGTIADVVPLQGENRVLARCGLTGLPDSRLTGLVALIRSARLENQKLDCEHVGFWLAPRLNAAGRMGKAAMAVELLTSADAERAAQIATDLEAYNRERQRTERLILQQAIEMVEIGRLAADARRGLVLASEGWHPGVIGIVASRLVERYGRPTVMIALENGGGQGSARSIRNFELHQALQGCAAHLVGFGGHAMAAGLRIETTSVPAFTEAFIERANQLLTARDMVPALNLDAEISPSDFDAGLVRCIEGLGPFGMGNPRPRLASPLMSLDGEPRVVGKAANHLQFQLIDGRGRRIKAIAFSMADRRAALMSSRSCKVAYEPCLNEFNGRVSVEARVLDLQIS